MKTGSVYVSNPSILHISGTSVGETWIIGSNYAVGYVEAESKE